MEKKKWRKYEKARKITPNIESGEFALLFGFTIFPLTRSDEGAGGGEGTRLCGDVLCVRGVCVRGERLRGVWGWGERERGE